MKYLFLLIFLYSSWLCAQDSSRSYNYLAAGVSGGVNNTFMGYDYNNAIANSIQTNDNNTTFSALKGEPKWSPMAVIQGDVCSVINKFKFKVGTSFLFYKSAYTEVLKYRNGGLGSGMYVTQKYDIHKQHFSNQTRIAFFLKTRYIHVGLGFAAIFELKKNEDAYETYTQNWYSGGSGGTGESYSGPARTYQKTHLSSYGSSALILEFPLEKIKAEITCRADISFKNHQAFLLVGFNKCFRLKKEN
ncbi:MAG: hypothetical protein Q8M29_10310 [Bacteroidota bacterium]|nr:hypothetical protein [Bacteroidota bacterium]